MKKKGSIRSFASWNPLYFVRCSDDRANNRRSRRRATGFIARTQHWIWLWLWRGKKRKKERKKAELKPCFGSSFSVVSAISRERKKRGERRAKARRRGSKRSKSMLLRLFLGCERDSERRFRRFDVLRIETDEEESVDISSLHRRRRCCCCCFIVRRNTAYRL